MCVGVKFGHLKNGGVPFCFPLKLWTKTINKRLGEASNALCECEVAVLCPVLLVHAHCARGTRTRNALKGLASEVVVLPEKARVANGTLVVLSPDSSAERSCNRTLRTPLSA